MRKISLVLGCLFWTVFITRFAYGTVEVFKNPSLALYMIVVSDKAGSSSTSTMRDLRMSFYLLLGANPNAPQYWGRSAFEEAVAVANFAAIKKLTPLVNEKVYLLGVQLACHNIDTDYEVLEYLFKARGEQLLTPINFCKTANLDS